MPDMNMVADWLKSLPGLAKSHLPSILGGLFAVAAAIFGWWRARRAWKNRQFLHRVNFSLNYVRDKGLKFRTLRESDIHEVFLNTTRSG